MSQQANGRLSGLVLASGFLVILDHSGMKITTEEGKKERRLKKKGKNRFSDLKRRNGLTDRRTDVLIDRQTPLKREKKPRIKKMG